MTKSLDRYALEARARADELLDLLSTEERDLLWQWTATLGREELIDIFMPPSPRTLTILSQTPSRDHRWQTKTPRPTFLREWLAARRWAIEAANAIQTAADIQDVPEREYRRFCRAAAQVASRAPDQPDIEDVIFLRMDG